jgi:hypothetical protein
MNALTDGVGMLQKTGIGSRSLLRSGDAPLKEARRTRLDWMRVRDYRIVEVRAGEVMGDIDAVLERILNLASP